MSFRVRTGLAAVSEGDEKAARLLRGRRVGLLAHPASVDYRFRDAHFILKQAGAKIEACFAPEHGFAGELQDMVTVTSERSSQLSVPVHSLYGESEEQLKPREEWIGGLDAIVIDLQDVGSRYYTFVWTAALILKAAADCGVETIVLDRPNPLGGIVVEGAPQRAGYRSFVGLYDVPVRHGLTIGEVCELVRRIEKISPDALHVIRMQGWERNMFWSNTGLPWISPSPNMPSPDTALVYPGACVLEGTNLSEGRGITRPFEIFGAPFVDGHRLAHDHHFVGAELRPAHFQPCFHKYKNQRCGGVQVHVTDRDPFRSYEAYLTMVHWIAQHAKDSFAWRTEAYEFVTDRLAIDLLTGGPEFRTEVESNHDLKEFFSTQRKLALESQRALKDIWLY